MNKPLMTKYPEIIIGVSSLIVEILFNINDYLKVTKVQYKPNNYTFEDHLNAQ